MEIFQSWKSSCFAKASNHIMSKYIAYVIYSSTRWCKFYPIYGNMYICTMLIRMQGILTIICTSWLWLITYLCGSTKAAIEEPALNTSRWNGVASIRFFSKSAKKSNSDRDGISVCWWSVEVFITREDNARIMIDGRCHCVRFAKREARQLLWMRVA